MARTNASTDGWPANAFDNVAAFCARRRNMTRLREAGAGDMLMASVDDALAGVVGRSVVW